VRPAEASDVAAVQELELTSFGADAWSRRSVEQELTADGRRALVAVEGERLLGYAVTWTVGEVTDLQRLVVAPDARRRGLGRRLVEELVDDAAGQGTERVLLEVSAANDAALACYRSVGFVEVDRRRAYYRDGSDALVLQRDLTAPAAPTEEKP
jgi:ribosomal-protein-alanine acetyltransferase